MLVSKIVALFEKKGRAITKAAIQNYIRIGLIPAPEKKTYTVDHIRLLAMVDQLKNAFSLSEIKEFFELAFSGPVQLPEQSERVLEVYSLFVEMSAYAIMEMDSIESQLNEEKPRPEQMFSIMCLSSIAKQRFLNHIEKLE
jgi:DNA-binding transcriptional MerR regulator